MCNQQQWERSTAKNYSKFFYRIHFFCFFKVVTAPSYSYDMERNENIFMSLQKLPALAYEMCDDFFLFMNKIQSSKKTIIGEFAHARLVMKINNS